MKKKTKFMTCILTQDEWNLIKEMFDIHEEYYEQLSARYPKNKTFKNKYKLVYHFNHVAIDNIEDLANKEERRRKK